MMLSEMARLLGYAVTTVYEPKAALRMIEEGSFDVVLSDFRMPEMNGEEFFRAAVSLRPELARRIIFLSGDVMSEETQEFFLISGAPWIQKPFRMGQVQATIQKVLAAEAVI